MNNIFQSQNSSSDDSDFNEDLFFYNNHDLFFTTNIFISPNYSPIHWHDIAPPGTPNSDQLRLPTEPLDNMCDTHVKEEEVINPAYFTQQNITTESTIPRRYPLRTRVQPQWFQAGLDHEYEVVSVIGERVLNERRQFLVEWKDSGRLNNQICSWVDEENCSCDQLIEEYRKIQTEQTYMF